MLENFWRKFRKMIGKLKLYLENFRKAREILKILKYHI